MCGCLSCVPHWGPGPQPRLGMCPDWESNWQPFGSWARAQSTEPHQPGLFVLRSGFLSPDPVDIWNHINLCWGGRQGCPVYLAAFLADQTVTTKQDPRQCQMSSEGDKTALGGEPLFQKFCSRYRPESAMHWITGYECAYRSVWPGDPPLSLSRGAGG